MGKKGSVMKKNYVRISLLSVLLLVLAGVVLFRYFEPNKARSRFVKEWMGKYDSGLVSAKQKSEQLPVAAPLTEEHKAILKKPKGFYDDLASAAVKCTKDNVKYDSAFVQISYPGGDVQKGKGVCTDHVIRAYRLMGIDLQKEVHEDMEANFGEYPKIWGALKTDTSIDHRRVPNLMVFFKRHGEVLPITKNRDDYTPGDIVCWNLGMGVTHIGIVSNVKTRSGRFFIAHNISDGQVLEDVLFDWEIIGHFRYKQ